MIRRLKAHFTALHVERLDRSHDIVWLSRWNDTNSFPITGTQLAHQGFTQQGRYLNIIQHQHTHSSAAAAHSHLEAYTRTRVHRASWAVTSSSSYALQRIDAQ